jgi:hypothetical protein
LITKSEVKTMYGLMPQDSPEGVTTLAVLLQDAVFLSNVQAGRVYALAEDAAFRKTTPSAPTVSYPELLRMIFDADLVVAL